MSTNEINRDCRNYAPVDVIKGICHLTKQIVLADDNGCSCFARLPKCAVCAHYTPSDQTHLGNCRAVPSAPMTYPDLIAITCELYTPKGS